MNKISSYRYNTSISPSSSFGAPGSGGHLGNTSLSLLHLGHHVTLFYIGRAVAEIIFDIFQFHLVENIQVSKHLHKTLVL